MNNKLSYFITKTPMFGIGYFLLFRDNGKNAWISIILGTILGLTIIYFYSLIKKKMNNHTLKEIFSNSKFGFVFNLLFIAFYIYLILIIMTILVLFISSFYLINTPNLIILIPFLLLAVYVSFKESFVLENLSNLTFYFSIIIVLLFTIFLVPYIDLKELLPTLNYNCNNIIKGSIIYALITSIPQILAIDYIKDCKYFFKNYLCASLINLLICLGTILALGEPLLKIYSFPEYDVLKQIKMLNFIENIENLSSFGWYAEMFIMISLLVSNLKKALPSKHNKIYLVGLILITIFISAFLLSPNYQNFLIIIYNYPIILSIFFIIFILFFFSIKKNNT